MDTLEVVLARVCILKNSIAVLRLNFDLLYGKTPRCTIE